MKVDAKAIAELKSEIGKVVLARLDWARAKVGEGSVGVKSVELFLRLHSSESSDDAVALVGGSSAVPPP